MENTRKKEKKKEMKSHYLINKVKLTKYSFLSGYFYYFFKPSNHRIIQYQIINPS